MYLKPHHSPGPGQYYGNDINGDSVFSLDNVKLNDYKLCRLKRSLHNEDPDFQSLTIQKQKMSADAHNAISYDNLQRLPPLL
jgi:hypothetical protein